MYLTEGEFQVLAQLPAGSLHKVRQSVPPFGIDVFEGEMEGLVLAEAEFDSPDAAERLILPSFITCEISGDARFTGGRLVRASRKEVRSWLDEFGLPLTP
jgi:CYTH domain-containing protein